MIFSSVPLSRSFALAAAAAGLSDFVDVAINFPLLAV
jgi:hypothetical protein